MPALGVERRLLHSEWVLKNSVYKIRDCWMICEILILKIGEWFVKVLVFSRIRPTRMVDHRGRGGTKEESTPVRALVLKPAGNNSEAQELLFVQIYFLFK